MRTESLELVFQAYTVVIENDRNYSVNSTDNVRSYQLQHLLTSDPGVASSRHSLSVLKDGQPLNSCIILAQGGASAIHAHTAIIYDESCLVAVGPYICRLKLPSLDLLWKTEVDSATCFGVYHSAKHACVISHGECEIARLCYDGSIVWSRGGKDIFTGEFSLLGDFVTAVDFNGETYKFAIVTGQGAIV